MTLNRPQLRSGRRETGQTLVEFALIFPIFLLVLFAVIEFAFVFSGMLGISYATRDAALMAAEAGNGIGADCVILRTVDNAVSAPAADARIESVIIYRANPDGTEISGISNRWNRSGSTSCPVGVGGSVPYTQQTNAYGESYRCNVLIGCPTDAAGAHAGLDTIGVRVTYVHQWVTPMGGFGGLGGSGFTLTQSNSMRMEPVL